MSELYMEEQRRLVEQFSEMTARIAAKLIGRELTPDEAEYLRGPTK